jgi:hypothetical protein
MKPPKKRARRSGEFEFVKYSTGSVIAPMIAFMSSTLFSDGRTAIRPAALIRGRAFQYWSKYWRCVCPCGLPDESGANHKPPPYEGWGSPLARETVKNASER